MADPEYRRGWVTRMCGCVCVLRKKLGSGVIESPTNITSRESDFIDNNILVLMQI